MKNTTALLLIAAGGILIYSGYKGTTIADTIKIIMGLESPPNAITGTPGKAPFDSKTGKPNFDNKGNPTTGTGTTAPTTPKGLIPKSGTTGL